MYLLQMTISLDHELNNSGAKNAKDYFDGMYGKKKNDRIYPAVFAVPKEKEDLFRKQNFTGNVDGKELDMGSYFEQWVAGI